MKINYLNKNYFWNTHTLNGFQQILICNNVHSYQITSFCFLKDGSIASSSGDNYILIYNKNRFKIEIRIKENKGICYMNVTKDGILITYIHGTYLNLYEIKNKKYKNIQTITPYSLFYEFVGIFEDIYSIQKFIELKNENLAILDWQHGICFYEKKKNSKNYSYLDKFRTKIYNRATGLVELDDIQYCVSFLYENLIKFLNIKLKNITFIIKTNIFISPLKNQIFLMNKNDFLAGNETFLIIDFQKKIIINNIHYKIIGQLPFIYRLTEKMILLNWGNYIEQIEYDEVKKSIKIISNFDLNSKIYDITSTCEFNNNLIVSSYKNQLGYFSLANIITSIRILCSIVLLAVSPFSIFFYILYLTAGLSDMIDGTIARKTGTVSEFGSKFDSIADIMFVTVCLIKLIPVLNIEKWLYIWIVLISVIKAVNIMYGMKKYKRIVFVHSILNKTTGLLVFVLPLSFGFVEFRYNTSVVCTIATIAAIQEGHFIRTGNI